MKLRLTDAAMRRIAGLEGAVEVNDLENEENWNEDGTITLYHRTTEEAAAQIVSVGRFTSRENTGDAYFSTRPDGQAESYGSTVVAADIDPAYAIPDDEFQDGEVHVTVSPRNQRKMKNVRLFQ